MSQPLRIVQIVPAISPVYGGPSQMVLGLSKALAGAGCAVTILTTDANGDSGQRGLDVPIDRSIWQDGYTVRYFRCAPFRRYKFSLPLLQWLTSHAQDFDLAHIHALFSPVSSAAASIARSCHLPYILRPLGTLDPADLRKKRRLKQIYAGLWERSNLAGAAALHFTSFQEANVSERFGVATEDLIVPLGVELPPASAQLAKVYLAELKLPNDRPILLFLSRIDRKKGLDLLIPALEQLLAEIPFHFVLAGANLQDPAYEAQIYARIQSSPLAHQTTITGFVTGDRKTALFQSAALFVLPSYYENFGIAIAEAMIAGVPVVISDRVHICGAIAQAEAGWICACNISALAQTLKAALQSPDRQQRGANARAYAQAHFGWETIAQQTIQAYKQVLAFGEDATLS